jgi:hypothetical protein
MQPYATLPLGCLTSSSLYSAKGIRADWESARRIGSAPRNLGRRATERAGASESIQALKKIVIFRGTLRVAPQFIIHHSKFSILPAIFKPHLTPIHACSLLLTPIQDPPPGGVFSQLSTINYMRNTYCHASFFCYFMRPFSPNGGEGKTA